MSPRLESVLVTGGAGFIGCALSHALAAEAEHWVVLDSLHPQVHPVAERPAALHEAAELVRGDVTSASDLDAVLERIQPEVVIHLAAETGTAQSLAESTRHSMVNVVGTTQLLDALTRIGHVPGHVVLTSSRAVYGEGEWALPDGGLFRPGLRTHAQLEAAQWDHGDGSAQPHRAGVTTPAPVNVYGATKLAQEHILSAWTGSRDTALTALRLQNVYGPGQSLTNPYTGIVSLFSQLAMRGESIPLYEDGEITRDFVFIDDVVSAITTAVRNRPDLHRLVDVGSGQPSTIRQLAETIAEFHSAPAPHVTGQFRDGDVRHASTGVDEQLVALGWKPQVTLAEGVAQLQAWIHGQLAER